MMVNDNYSQKVFGHDYETSLLNITTNPAKPVGW